MLMSVGPLDHGLREFRGVILPALAFDPRLVDAAEAVLAGRALAMEAAALAVVAFLDGDRFVARGHAAYGLARTAWPNGPQPRTLPVVPAVQLRHPRRVEGEDLFAWLAPQMRAEGCRRTFEHDTWLIGADGRLRAVYWGIEFARPAHARVAGRRR